MAIMTRWRMPPDIWCGYSSTRVCGGGDADLFEHLDRVLARLGLALLQVEHDGLAIWYPTVKTGLSEVIGSWKIMEMSRPADRPHLGLGQRGEVLAVEEDLALDDASGRRDEAHRREGGDDLPQPDSPTTPSVLPL
jgi:hypothetical protein